MSSRDSDTSAARDPFASGASIGSARVDESPHVVIRGETPQSEIQPSAAALVDWLAFSVKPPLGHGLRWLVEALRVVFRVPGEQWTGRARGWFGYTHRIDLGEFGLLAYGGKSQNETLHVELNAQACRRVTDWHAIRVWGEVYGAAITRVDCAHDDFSAAVLSIARAIEWFRSGAFTDRGRPPKGHLHDDLDSGAGKTLEIGRRGSGKFLRIYERGKKLGDPDSPWVRAEVELHNKGRSVPWEVVINPGHYLAGAYPPLTVLNSTQSRIATTRRTAEMSYERMVDVARTQGGKAINVMWHVLGGDCAAVVADLRREGVPKRLSGYSGAELRALLGAAP
jgi:phage replication initiation protein